MRISGILRTYSTDDTAECEFTAAELDAMGNTMKLE